ncbi:hypothetical protein A8F94_02170 [Bacillus sp. FJAT-27225]|nr:hypothetical protein A8F94_02170 [Bacillus sp. FJAT-27225]
MYAPENVRFANFGERVVASLIDYVILYIVGFLLSFLFGAIEGSSLYNLMGFILGIAYKAGLESSNKQATLGKMAMGLKVADNNGEQISFARAIGRYFANVLNIFTLFIGYLMVLWTKEKRALHDFVAGTYVIKSK